MNHPLAMRIANHVGNLAENVEPMVHGERSSLRLEEVVETLRLRIGPEKQHRTVFALGRHIGANHPRMIQTFQDLEFALRRRAQHCAVFAGGLATDHVNPSASGGLLIGDMASQPVLEGTRGTLEEQLLEREVTDTARALGRAETRLLHGLRNGADERAVQRR